jgi:hypothetical protein
VATRSKQRGYFRGIEGSEIQSAGFMEKSAQYSVSTVRKKLKEFEREPLEGGWEQVRSKVEVKLVSTPAAEETYVLCRSAARKEKEKAIRSRLSTRMDTALNKLKKRGR